MAIAKLGGESILVGCVGADTFGAELLQHLTANGVQTLELRTLPTAATGTACILVDHRGMNSIVVAAGANGMVTAEQVESAQRKYSASVVLAQLEVPLEAVLAASAAERFILNPAPAWFLPSELLSHCYAITPNESETEFLTGINPNSIENCELAGRKLRDCGVQNVVITLGDRGSYWTCDSAQVHFPAPTVEAIDTTAAGDAFSGSLALFIAQGRDLGNAIPLANHVGALATTRTGAQESMPTIAELKAFAGNFF